MSRIRRLSYDNMQCLLLDLGAVAASQSAAAAGKPSETSVNSSSDVSRFHVNDSHSNSNSQLTCESHSVTDDAGDRLQQLTAAADADDLQTAEDILSDLDNS